MEKKTNLDDYLAGLGISDSADESPIDLDTAYQSPSSPIEYNVNPQEVVEHFLKGLCERVDPGLTVKVRMQENVIYADITGVHAAKMIGRDGRVLAALEVMCYTLLAKEAGRNDLRLHLDAAGFRRRHEDKLVQLAERIAQQVMKTGEPFEMDPIPASDRRIIHMTLKEMSGVTTESVGEGKDRHIIVKPA
ncbi:Jag family protein [Deinococcus cellulosilyticus]|uniref:RNA-binding protein n=1 Tax=Deinococcus cellulosilyticus (strain DSM 18568 / NBRC 106333 / KACC 11606 / 5516J-15) TaxID=1223518 RepID=A0A511N5M5_DEIC1|nr:R3H domain-containing nucleic acid-binding protein [Deinococcus cellulosilyticus]GEM48169.1 RNA-binding protein [Deinococcus cellulosilyticus NBRC 106333 = KACC 11606]